MITPTEPVQQVGFKRLPPNYGSLIEPFRLNIPTILIGLDTIITGNVDHLMGYCFKAHKVALPRAVYMPDTICNGVALIPRGHRDIYYRWHGENDMDWLREQEYDVLDDLFPGAVVSYKEHVKENELGDARIVMFHGPEKPHELDEPWIRKNWR